MPIYIYNVDFVETLIKALRLIENILKLFTTTAGEENWTSCVRHAFGYGINVLEAIRVNFISRSFFGSQEHFSVLRFSAPGILYSIFTTVQHPLQLVFPTWFSLS